MKTKLKDISKEADEKLQAAIEAGYNAMALLSVACIHCEHSDNLDLMRTLEVANEQVRILLDLAQDIESTSKNM